MSPFKRFVIFVYILNLLMVFVSCNSPEDTRDVKNITEPEVKANIDNNMNQSDEGDMNESMQNNDKFQKFLEILDPKTQIPKSVQPLFDYGIRDTHIALGGDGYYYLTDTTRMPEITDPGVYNDGIRLWKSMDLKNWEELGLVWSFEKDATWQNEFKYEIGSDGKPKGAKKRAVWAPEIHYIKGNYYITASLNWPAQKPGEEGLCTFLLRSSTGKAEGPYEDVGDGPFTTRIDSSLFCDDDGTVYYIWQNGMIARMKDDMSGLAEEPRLMIQQHFKPELYCEGAFVFKHNGKYYLSLAIWMKEKDGELGYFVTKEKYRFSYDCVVASADNIYGPYGERYACITGGGHNSFFVDKEGKWWATMFGNPVSNSFAPFYRKPAIIPMKWNELGQIYPDADAHNQKIGGKL